MIRLDPDSAPSPVVVIAERYLPGPGHSHKHRRCQLIHASEGVLTATPSWVCGSYLRYHAGSVLRSVAPVGIYPRSRAIEH